MIGRVTLMSLPLLLLLTGFAGEPMSLRISFDGPLAGPAWLGELWPISSVPARPEPVEQGRRRAAALGTGRWSHQAQKQLLARRNPDPKASFTMAVIGDAEPGRFPWERALPPPDDAFERQLRAIHAAAPDMVVQLGDLVSDGSEDNYRDAVSLLEREVRLPFFGVIGNHDRSKPNGKAEKDAYQGVFGELDYFIDHNGWRLVFLDSADRAVRQDQLEWLAGVLDTRQRKIVFTHVVPAFLKGKFHSPAPAKSRAAAFFPADDTGSGDYWEDVFNAYFEPGSEVFGELMAAFKVERVYMGHIHAFGIAEFKGVRYVLTGGGGSPLYPLLPPYPQRRMAHFLMLTLGPSGLTETVYPLDGAPFPID